MDHPPLNVLMWLLFIGSPIAVVGCLVIILRSPKPRLISTSDLDKAPPRQIRRVGFVVWLMLTAWFGLIWLPCAFWVLHGIGTDGRPDLIAPIPMVVGFTMVLLLYVALCILPKKKFRPHSDDPTAT